ncbi:Adhesion G protein-coupled receptor G3 [Acipenser ruthenus]|uniref:Adhesion G protein-coupled receptor G3 n=1 Tax=Acipenser ruthenus TaxID=7906 RepID=A0A662YTU1_ACIRT|nr:Adhesion G protein-coupled receptor G3 [Acipenser ruthenus]
MSESLQKQEKDFLSKISKCDKKSVEQCNDVVSSISKAIKNILTDKTAFDGPKKEINFTGFYGIVAKYNITDKKPLLIPLPLQDTHSVEIKLTLEALQQASGHNNDSSQYGVGRFLNSNLFPDEQNSSLLSDEVIAIELGSPISDLTDNITITFYHEDTLQNPNNITLSASTLKALTYISYIGCGVSLFFLGVVLFMYFILWKQKSDDSTTIHQSLCSALFLLNLTFLLNEWLASYNNDGLCQFIAALMHYSLLCTFTWFGIEAFHLYLLMIKVFNTFKKHYRMKLSLAGWGFFLFLRYWNSAKTRRSTEKLDQTRTDTVLTSNPTSTVVNETGIETGAV